MTQGFLETFSAELRSEKWNRGGGLDFKWKLMREKYKNVNG
jgi:hypothetical protein